MDNRLIDLTNGGRGVTMLQKRAYLLSKAHWIEEEKKQAQKRSSNRTPTSQNGMNTKTYNWSRT